MANRTGEFQEAVLRHAKDAGSNEVLFAITTCRAKIAPGAHSIRHNFCSSARRRSYALWQHLGTFHAPPPMSYVLI